MPIDAAQVKWDSAPAAIDPAAVKWDGPDVMALRPDDAANAGHDPAAMSRAMAAGLGDYTPPGAKPAVTVGSDGFSYEGPAIYVPPEPKSTAEMMVDANNKAPSNTSFIDMLDRKLDPLRQMIGQGPVKVNPDNYQTSALDQARSTFRFNAAKATPAQAQDPAFSAKLLRDAAAEFNVPASQIAQADDQTSHFVPTGAPAASAAFMSGAAKPIVDAMGVVPLVAGGVASLGGLAPNAASDALFSAHDTLQRSSANGGEQDVARSQVAGQLGELGSSVATFMALPEARGLHIAERMASGSDLASRLAPFAEHAAANLPRAIAAGGITQGVSGADAVLNHGGDVSQALGEYAVGLGGGTAQFVAPVSLGGGWVSRMAAGTVSQQALQQGTAQAQNAIDPVAFPQGAQPFDPENPMSYLGSALGLFGGRGGDRGGFGKDFNDYVAGQRSGELGADATARGASPINPQPVGPDALALPRGADFTARAEPIRPAPVDLGGAVRVGASGEAATPQQGAAALGDAITAGSTGNPALPAPVVKVDKTGQAMDSRAENQSFIDQAKSALADSQTRSRLDQLGLTPDIEKIITKAQDRNAASLPEPDDSHIATQGGNDAPPWWLAGQHEQAQQDARLAAPPDDARDGMAPKRNMIDTGRKDSKGRPIKVPALDYARGDTLLHWLAASGGIDAGQMQKQTGLDPKSTSDPSIMNPMGNIGMPAVRRKGGMSLEQAYERMQQDGWFPDHDPNAPPKTGAQDAADLIHEALNGQQVFHPYEGAEAKAAAMEDEYRAKYGGPEDATPEQAKKATRLFDATNIPSSDHHEAAMMTHLVDTAYTSGVSESDILSAINDHDNFNDRGEALANAIVKRNQDVSDQAASVRTGAQTHQPAQERAPADVAQAGQEGGDAPGTVSRAVREQTDMFGAAKPSDHLRAEQEKRDAQRNGKTGSREDTGDGGLFDGKRPEQDDALPNRVEQPAYHGTPHTVDKFSMQKIGTGEGAQAYGYGMYFASSKAIAQHYRDVLGGAKAELTPKGKSDLSEAMNFAPSLIDHTAQMLADGSSKNDVSRTLRDGANSSDQDLNKWKNDVADAVESGDLTGHKLGNVYHVEVPEDHDLLDYDKRLDQQPPNVKAAMEAIGKQLPESAHDELADRANADWMDLKGKEAYQYLARLASEGDLPDQDKLTTDNGNPHQAASEYLNHAGIPGLRYLDGSSRGAGEGSHNYVIWDEGAIGAPNKVGASTRDMFTRTRGDDAAPENDRELQVPHDEATAERPGTGASEARPQNVRPDWTPSLGRRGKYEVDALVRRFGGSTLADSIARDFREKDTAQLIGRTVKGEQDLAALVHVYRNPIFETMRYIFVDSEGRVIGETAVSSRMVSSSAAFPDNIEPRAQHISHWLHSVAPSGATGVWLSHNHPSGNPEPSDADLGYTGSLNIILNDQPGSLKLLGHVVTDHDTYGRITPGGDKRPIGRLPSVGEDPNVRRTGADIFDVPLKSPSYAAVVGKTIADLTPADSVAVVVLSGQGKVITAMSIPAEALATKRGLAMLDRVAKKSGGVAVHLVAEGKILRQYESQLKVAESRGFLHDVLEIGPEGEVASRGAVKDMAKRAILGKQTKVTHAMQERGSRVFEEANFDRDTMGDIGDMPSRRPGESQSEYVARIYRKSGTEIKAATSLAKNDRKLGRYAVRAYAAKNARNMDISDAAMKQARQLFDKTPDVINYASVDQWERGEKIDDADFRHFISMMKEGFDQRIEAIHELAPGALETLIEQYMPHMYEDTGKALKWYQTTMGKKPMQGDKSFLKQRTWPTLKEAMSSGLRPISPNPVDWVMMKYQQMDKFIHMLQLIKGMKERGWIMKLDPGQRAPEGFTVPDDAAFLIASGLQGRLAIPEMIAKDLNNYLTPGLSKYGAWRSLRAAQNAMVSWNLGWSAFHAGFTSIDNAVTHGAVGLQRLADGDIKGGLATLVKSVPTMLLSPLEGARLNREFRHMPASGLDRLSGKVPALDKMIFGNTFDDPNVHAILDALTEGGARFKMGAASAEYNNALPRVLRTIRRMQAPGWLSDSLDGVKRTARTNTALENVKGAVTAGPKALGSALSAIGEVSSFLIHHVLVPNQKMAARVMLMKFELDHAAGDMRARGYDVENGEYSKIIDIMHPDVLKQLASDVVDKVDFRLGQMTYDNFFYPKVAREIAQVVVMAPGWQVGAFQTMTGGLRDIGRLIKPEKLVAPSLDKEGRITDSHRPRFTNNVANLIMLFVMVGGSNALYQYLVTGKDADDPKDFVGPRIGGKNPDDSDRRVMAPSYMKDHYEFFHDFPHGAIAMASHKLHPFWRDMWELTHNQDYFGVRIRDEYGPKMDQVEDVAKYLLKSMMPFTVKNSQKIAENDGTIGQHAASFVGVTPAPASFARTEFQRFVAGNGTKGYDNAVRTPEQAALTKAKRTAEDAIRAGGHPDLSSFDPRAKRDVMRQSTQLVPEVRFSKMSMDDKLRGYDMATPAERTRYHLAQQIERSNVRKSVAFQRMSDEDRQSIIDRIAQIRKEGSSGE